MLNNENYLEILSKNCISLVYISGEGCANCVSMYPQVMKLKEREDICVYMIEASEENSALNHHYGVEVVPTILLLHYGECVAKIKGYQPEEIFEYYIDAKINEIKEG